MINIAGIVQEQYNNRELSVERENQSVLIGPMQQFVNDLNTHGNLRGDPFVADIFIFIVHKIWHMLFFICDVRESKFFFSFNWT